MCLHAYHQSKMFDEKFVFNFEHEMAGNQLWNPEGVGVAKDGRGSVVSPIEIYG